ncbi:MAG: hypothetical protein Q8P11_00325 [bacterium]|nr:hypothetical protein [bacterium]
MHLHFDTALVASTRFVRHFLPHKLTPQMKELFVSVWIQSFALAAVSLFEPIYLYTLGYPVYAIMLFYCAVYVVYFFLIPLGGKFVKRKGFAHGMVFGSFFLVLYYIFLFEIPHSSGFLYLAVIAYALQKMFFWPAFHGDFVFFGKSAEEGRELGIMQVIASLVVILGPLFGGFVIALFGFQALFIVVVLLILLSNVPLFLTKEVFVPSGLEYKECYRELFTKEHRRQTIGLIGYGEELVWQFAWPIFAYVVLTNIVGLGTLVATSTVISSMVLLYVGRIADRKNENHIMRTGIYLYISSWVLRIFSMTGIWILISDTFSRMVRYPVQLPITVEVYRDALKSKHVIKSVIRFEMGLAIGKILAAMSVAAMFYFGGGHWNLVFLLGGLFSLLYLSLIHRGIKITPNTV